MKQLLEVGRVREIEALVNDLGAEEMNIPISLQYAPPTAGLLSGCGTSSALEDTVIAGPVQTMGVLRMWSPHATDFSIKMTLSCPNRPPLSTYITTNPSKMIIMIFIFICLVCAKTYSYFNYWPHIFTTFFIYWLGKRCGMNE